MVTVAVTTGPSFVRCAALMGKQHGVITRAQALKAGLSRRQIDHLLGTGMWLRLHRGVYATIESPSGWHQRAMAACLWAGPGAAVSHRSAGLLWKLPGIVSPLVEITTTRSLRGPGVVVHRSEPLTRDELARIAGFPVTAVERTLLSLSAVVHPYRFEVALDDALRRGLTSLERLQLDVEAPARGRAGAAVFRKSLESYRHSPLESPLERRFLRMLRAAGLPEPEAQYEIHNAGRLVARVDFAYPGLLLAIEVDGYRWHSGKHHLDRDRDRRNDLTELRWRILHITHEAMSGPEPRAIELVWRAHSSGWAPPP